MKKLYSTIMMLAMMAAALSLSACGGSDDDEIGGDGGGSSTSSTFTIIYDDGGEQVFTHDSDIAIQSLGAVFGNLKRGDSPRGSYFGMGIGTKGDFFIIFPRQKYGEDLDPSYFSVGYSDSDPQSYKINDVVKMGNEKVDASVTIIGELYQVDFSVILKKVDNNWLIDSITEKETVSSNSFEYESVLSKRKLSESDLRGKTKKELEIMRNSVYAHYGYSFKRDDLFNYFSQYSWYNPTTSDMSTIYNTMTDIEQYNVDFIKKHE